jgi:hypothetical protein
MKRMLYGFVALALLVALQSQATAKKKPPPPPDTYVVFYATGQFYESGELTGTVTIDTTTGKAVSADLAIPAVGEVFNGTPSTYTNFAGNVEIIVDGNNGTGIELVIPSASLKGYAGGDLVVDGGMVGNETHWWWPVYSFGDLGIDPLGYGSLVP